MKALLTILTYWVFLMVAVLGVIHLIMYKECSDYGKQYNLPTHVVIMDKCYVTYKDETISMGIHKVIKAMELLEPIHK